jgi:starvation-inducible DNA-binding protein
VALGAVAEGTTNSVIERTQLAKYPAQVSEGLAHVDALANAYATFGKAVREAIDEAGRAGDADTSDLFTGISRGMDKSLWLLEAHRQAER